MSEDKLSKLTIEELLKHPVKDLLTLQSNLAQAIEQRKEQERSELLNKINSLASDAGFSLSELLADKPVKKAPAKARYRNPNNKDETWTGKGRKPKWLDESLKAGRQLEEFEI